MKRYILSLAVCLSVGSLAHAQVPTLTNFGFELPNVGTGSFTAFQYNPTGAGWTFTGNSGVAGNGSGFTSGNPAAPQGTQVGFLQGTSAFSQGFTIAAPLSSFSVSFLAAQRSNAVAQATSQTFTVFVDSILLGTYTPATTTYTPITTSSVVLGAGSHTLTFTGTNPLGGDNTALLDNVQLAGVVVVPEAGTATLLGTVLPLVGSIVVLRRKARG